MNTGTQQGTRGLEHLDQPGKPGLAIIGAGPAGLMAAEVAARGGLSVTIYDRMPSVGRKFLLAGRGGLNLTHSEPLEIFLARYGAAAARLRPMIERWTPEDVRAWCEGLGQPVFTGTSGRVFPVAFKTSPLLRAWLRRLASLGVTFKTRHRWMGWDAAGHPLMETPDGVVQVEAGAVILALGGASWPQLGSDGGWAGLLRGEGVEVTPLRPSNCGAAVAWSAHFREKFEGQPLKAVALGLGDRTSRGELVVTRAGLEGGAIYALSGPLRDALAEGGTAKLVLALKPDLSRETIETRLQSRQPKQSLSTALRKLLNLSPVAIGLLREAEAHGAGAIASMAPGQLATLVNAVPIQVIGAMPLAKAISSAGGVALTEVDESLMLRARPGTFVAGEMLDWDAPTGGYLLQACFATGATAGRGASAWLNRARPEKINSESEEPSRS
ncbi:MAG: TIGR03862 family flavoprotein [Beijerinckiaceae bacterium]|nr:TIGR03862 family flavoprotein [Beijerinckiaceae bacterium]